MKKVTVSFTEEQFQGLAKIAKEKGESKSTILRIALELYLQAQKSK